MESVKFKDSIFDGKGVQRRDLGRGLRPGAINRC